MQIRCCNVIGNGYSRNMKNKDRQKLFKERRKALGLERYEFWLTPAVKKAVDELLNKRSKTDDK